MILDREKKMKRFIISVILTGLTICSICACGKKEEPVAEEETTVAEEKTEEAKPAEPVKVEKSETVEEEPVDYTWAKEYLDIIYDWHMNHTGDQAEGYSLIYLNDDDIPELCLFCTDDVSVATDIHTFSDNKANHVDRVDYQFDIRETPYTIMGGQGHGTTYIEKKGILFNGYAGGGTSEDEGYILNDACLEPFISVLNSQSIDDTGEEVDDYIVRYKKKDGSFEEDHGAGELFLDEDNKYIDIVEAEFNFDYDNIIGIGDDKFYSYDEIKNELKALLPSDLSKDKSDYSWVNSYITYLKDVNAEEYPMGAIIYVNDDEIPEIILEGAGGYLGSIGLTIGKDNSVKDHGFASVGYEHYIPYNNTIHDFHAVGGGADDDISCIEDGDWKVLFYGDYAMDETNHDFKIYETGYWENGGGHGVSEAEYNATMDEIFKERGYDESKANLVEDEHAYSISELIDGLKKMRPTNTDEETEQSEPWKAAYRNYLNDVVDGIESLPDLLEVVYYSPSGDIRFATQDITGDGTPELFVSGVQPDKYHYWGAWTLGSDGKIKSMGYLSYYDPNTNEAYVSDGTSFESYTVYSVDNGGFNFKYMIGETDMENPYFMEDQNGNQMDLSYEDMEAFRSGFNAGLEKYGIKGKELTKENIEKEFEE